MPPRSRWAAALSCVLLLELSLLLPRSDARWGMRPEDYDYIVVLDAGSTGTRAHVYKYSFSEGIPYPHVSLPEPQARISPGLLAFAHDPAGAGASLQQLLQFAALHVPEERQQYTPLLLAATIKMRLLDAETQGRILDSCHAYAKAESRFETNRAWMSILSGRERGALGWLAVNFLQHRLVGMERHGWGTFACVEMGGVSAQTTVELEYTEEEEEGIFHLRVGGEQIHLNTHSYVDYGGDAARARYNELLIPSYIAGAGVGRGIVTDPCLPYGFSKAPGVGSKNVHVGPATYGVVGSGDLQQCYARVAKLFDKEKACGEPPCSFDGVHQPDLTKGSSGSAGLVLFGNFYFTAKALEMRHIQLGTSVGELFRAGARRCMGNTTVQAARDEGLCFTAAYYSAFLTVGLNVAADAPIRIFGSANGTDEYTLGKMIVHSVAQRQAKANQCVSEENGDVVKGRTCARECVHRGKQRRPRGQAKKTATFQ